MAARRRRGVSNRMTGVVHLLFCSPLEFLVTLGKFECISSSGLALAVMTLSEGKLAAANEGPLHTMTFCVDLSHSLHWYRSVRES